MIRKTQNIALAFLASFSQLLVATDATWTGSTNADLNTSTNWTGNAVPTGVATFDSSYPSVQLSPTAVDTFSIDSLYFPHQASNFLFTLTGPGALNFTGTGITGNTTDPQITATNSTSMNAQIYFSSTSLPSSTSLGQAQLSLTNSYGGTIAFGNAAQLVLADSNAYQTSPLTAGDDISITAINNGQIAGGNEGAQIFLKGSSFSAGNNAIFTLTNSGTGAVIQSYSDTGQILFDAASTTASLTVGNNAVFTCTNGGTTTSSFIGSYANNAGQIIFDGVHGVAPFVVGNHASLTFINQYGSTITAASNGNDTGQMIFDGDRGVASFASGDYTTLTMSNEGSSFINGFGLNAGQLVIDGDGGTASVNLGNYATVTLNNNVSEITAGPNGSDCAQLLVVGGGGTGSFTAGDNATITLNNINGSTISGYHNTGQIVVSGNVGAASFTLGDNSSVTVNHSGVILLESGGTGTGASTDVAGQIIFNGDQTHENGVFLNTGKNVSITAVLSGTGTVLNDEDLIPSAQMYFSDTTINGGPTLTAINQTNGYDVTGMFFDGNSTADGANIVLVNTSCVVNTSTPSAFSIASLSGDSTSIVVLFNQDLEINTEPTTYATFAGILGNTGTSNLYIDGLGFQVLSGTDPFSGLTTVNGGNLIVKGAPITDAIVNGGVLSGTGIIGGDLTVNSGGTVSPGLSLGTLTVAGDYTQNSGGSFLVDISGTISNGIPQCGLLAVDGTATLDGNLEVGSADGTYVIGQPYTILTANTLSGTFAQTTVINPFLNVTTIYNEDPSVQLTLSTNFEKGAVSRNQQHVAQQIDGVATPTADLAVVINNLLDIFPQNLPEALEQMTGEQYTYLAEMDQYSDRRFTRRIFDALRYELDPSFCGLECGEVATWGTVEVGRGFAASDSQAHGFNQCNIDLSLGAYTPVNPCTLFGIAANFETNHLSFNIGGSDNVYNGQAGFYISYTSSDFYLFSDLVVGKSTSHFDRRIKFGDIDEKAHSSPNLWHGTWYGEAGLNLCACSVFIQPFLGVDVSYVSIPQFTEHCADALNLHIHNHSVTCPNTYLGAHLGFCEGCFDINGDLAWQHRYGSLGTKLNVNFVDFGDTYTINGSTWGCDGFLADLNISANITDYLNVYGEISGEIWNRWCTYSGSIGIRCNW
ncbi:MAG: autotransporter domain-containing protein [Parachlamydiaceae bacterium]